MALTAFGTNDAQTVKRWSTMAFREAMKSTFIFKFLGDNKRSVLRLVEDLIKNAGDTVKYDLLMQATGDGVTGDNEIRHNEEEMIYYQDSVVVDQLRNGHAFRRMTQQRTVHDLRKDAQSNLSDWMATKLDEYMFRYLCGDTTINHGQSGVAPDSDHYIVSGDVSKSGTIATDEASLSNNDQIDLMDLDYAKEQAMTISPMIEPARVDGNDYYIAVLHPYSMTDIRTSANTSATIKWSDIQQYANVRGLKNPIFSGADGVYNGIILYQSSRIYSPVTNVRRNLLLGAEAGVLAIANPYDKVDQKKFGKKLYMSWYEGTDDAGNEKYVVVGMVLGVKACVFNSKFRGHIVITSWSASHAG